MNKKTDHLSDSKKQQVFNHQTKDVLKTLYPNVEYTCIPQTYTRGRPSRVRP